MTKPRRIVVFVGAFREGTNNGVVGGQIYACRSLLSSGISGRVRFVLIDSTMISVPPPGILVRGIHAARRVLLFAWQLVRHRRAAALIFSGDGVGFLEKGTMALIGRALRRNVVFCPRSGMIVDDLERSAGYRWYMRRVIDAATSVVCQGTRWRAAFITLSPGAADRMHVVPNWIDTTPYDDIAARRRPPAGSVTFLYMGWLEPFKGITDLIDAVGRFRDDLAGARFVICGGGSLSGAMLRAVDAAGLSEKFDFRGWVVGADKLAALAEADVLVLPSRREGMPNALLEAMASGLPVVATRVGAIEDTVADGAHGYLVDPENIYALGAALVRARHDVQALTAMGAEARQRVIAYHDVRSAWPALLSLLESEP